TAQTTTTTPTYVQKPSIEKFGAIHSARRTIAMLIARYANPRVTTIRGSARTVSTGLSTVFAIPSTAAPIRYAAQPWMRTLSHSAFATQSAAAFIAHAVARRISHGTRQV